MKKLGIIIAAFGLAIGSYADIEWFHDISEGNPILDEGAVAVVGNTFDSSVGSFLQLIWAGPNGTIQAADGGATDGAGGDDLVVDTSWIGRNIFGPNDGFAGAGPAFTGDLDGGVYYVRAWNQASPNFAGGEIPLISSFYGNSVVTLTNPNDPIGEPPDLPTSFEFAPNASGTLQTTIAIPEPTVLALFAIGLIGLRTFRKKSA